MKEENLNKKILSLLLVSTMAIITISSCASDTPQLLKFIDENEVYTADFRFYNNCWGNAQHLL